MYNIISESFVKQPYILRAAILYGDCAEIITEAMDDFSDDLLLRKKYVFSGIESFY